MLSSSWCPSLPSAETEAMAPSSTRKAGMGLEPNHTTAKKPGTLLFHGSMMVDEFKLLNIWKRTGKHHACCITKRSTILGNTFQ